MCSPTTSRPSSRRTQTPQLRWLQRPTPSTRHQAKSSNGQPPKRCTRQHHPLSAPPRTTGCRTQTWQKDGKPKKDRNHRRPTPASARRTAARSETASAHSRGIPGRRRRINNASARNRTKDSARNRNKDAAVGTATPHPQETYASTTGHSVTKPATAAVGACVGEMPELATRSEHRRRQ